MGAPHIATLVPTALGNSLVCSAIVLLGLISSPVPSIPTVHMPLSNIVLSS
jgi:hypothetical protein